MAREWQKGDIVPNVESKVCKGGAPRWYAFTVPPQGEKRAQAFLKRKDIYSFFPVIKKARFHHITRAKIEYEVPMIPRYVFAKMPGEPLWHVLTAQPLITGVVGHLGCPVALTSKSITTLHKLRDTASQVERKKREAEVIRAGDKVVISEGLLANQFKIVEVSDIRNGFALLPVGMIGRAEIEVSIANLQKVQ